MSEPELITVPTALEAVRRRMFFVEDGYCCKCGRSTLIAQPFLLNVTLKCASCSHTFVYRTGFAGIVCNHQWGEPATPYKKMAILQKIKELVKDE